MVRGFGHLFFSMLLGSGRPHEPKNRVPHHELGVYAYTHGLWANEPENGLVVLYDRAVVSYTSNLLQQDICSIGLGMSIGD